MPSSGAILDVTIHETRILDAADVIIDVIPEPGAFSIAAAGLALMGWQRRRKRRRA